MQIQMHNELIIIVKALYVMELSEHTFFSQL